MSGCITYNGHTANDFLPKRTVTYVPQVDLHLGELTVRETLDFGARCLGAGTSKGEAISGRSKVDAAARSFIQPKQFKQSKLALDQSVVPEASSEKGQVLFGGHQGSLSSSLRTGVTKTQA